MKRKVITIISILLLSFTFIPSVLASNQNEDLLRLATEYEELIAKYDIGEEISLEDLEQIDDLTKQMDNISIDNNDTITISQTKNWSIFGTNKVGGLEGDISGTVTYTEGFVNHSVKGNLTATGVRGSIAESRARLNTTAYGLVSGGVVILSNPSVSSGWKSSRNATVSGTDAFSGLLLYITGRAYGDFRNSTTTLTAVDTNRTEF